MRQWLILFAIVMFIANVDVILIRSKRHEPVPLPNPIRSRPPSYPISPLPKIDFTPTFVAVSKYRASEQDNVYGDVLSHSSGAPFGDSGGRGTNVHETTHGINSQLRNQESKGKRINGFYVLNGRGVILEEPNVKMADAIRLVPQSLHSYRWDLYMNKQLPMWNNTSTYIFDEWVAYVNGGACEVDDIKKGKFKGGWTDGVSGCCDFSIYAIALGLAVKQKDPVYWQQNLQFRKFLVWELKFAEQIFMEGRTMSQLKWKKQDDLLLAFLQSPEAAPLREFCRQELEGAWIDINPETIKNSNYNGTPVEIIQVMNPLRVCGKPD